MDTKEEIKEIKKRLKKLENGGDNVVVAVVLDKSGSMEAKRSEAISGFNEFLEANKKATPNAKIVFTLFDSLVHKPEVSVVKDARKLSKGKYVPGGMTALYDAIGETIKVVDKIGGKRVAIAIITDGYENNSREFDRSTIFSMVTDRKSKDWKFTFIGADIDAYGVAENIGINVGSTLSAVGGRGLSAGYVGMTNSVVSYTTGQSDSLDYDEDTKSKVGVTTK